MRFKEKLKKPKFVLMGINTYLPETVGKFLPKHQAQFTGKGVRVTHKRGMDHIARSAYTTWLRFLVTFDQLGMPTKFDSVGEIGPGDSFSMGLAAMLTGTTKYFTLDVVDTATNFPNEEILDRLVELFKNKTPIPDNIEFPKNRPRLSINKFPSHILTDELLAQMLSPERIKQIKNAIKVATEKKVAKGDFTIERIVGWDNKQTVDQHKGSMNLIISIAAMEHVDDVEGAYLASAQLLSKDGYIAHAIDYKCHDSAGQWNGHLTYSDKTWKIIRGKSVFFINRYPHSYHLRETNKYFEVVNDDCYVRANELERSDLAKRFKDIPDSDLVTSETFLIAKKK